MEDGYLVHLAVALLHSLRDGGADLGGALERVLEEAADACGASSRLRGDMAAQAEEEARE